MENHESGFSLAELVAVMAIMSVLAGVGFLSFASRHQMTVHTGSAETLVAELRSTAQRAIAEGRTYCVSLKDAGRTAATYQADCSDLSSATAVAQTVTQDPDVTVSASHPAGVTSGCEPGQCIRFTPRGTATSGRSETDGSYSAAEGLGLGPCLTTPSQALLSAGAIHRRRPRHSSNTSERPTS